MARNVTYRGEKLSVVDDFLPHELVERLRADLLRSEDYVKVGAADRWHKIWHLGAGSSYFSGFAPIWRRVGGDADSADGTRSYPTGTCWDEFIECVETLLPEVATLAGGKMPSRFSARCTIYGREAQLPFHADEQFLASYTYYLHPQWNVEFDGDLVTHDVVTSLRRDAIDLAAFRNDEITREVGELGAATAIQPSSNRLVLLAGGAMHKVLRVDRRAGNVLRIALNGFFLH